MIHLYLVLLYFDVFQFVIIVVNHIFWHSLFSESCTTSWPTTLLMSNWNQESVWLRGKVDPLWKATMQTKHLLGVLFTSATWLNLNLLSNDHQNQRQIIAHIDMFTSNCFWGTCTLIWIMSILCNYLHNEAMISLLNIIP